MALINADRIKELSKTKGVGDFILNGPVPGYKSFNSVANVNDTFYYCIYNPSRIEWETGIGRLMDASRVRRLTVHSSSNNNNKVNFGNGTKEIFIAITKTQLDSFKTVGSMTGATGVTGASGATGSTGTTGQTGQTGQTGAVGQTGIGVTGHTGATGVTGPTGAAGSTGATGVTGVIGVTGVTGVTGPEGATGQTGQSGAAGVTGVAGPEGITGQTGQTGTTGQTGQTGATGASGAAGAAGQTGITGVTGVTGATGVTGQTGARGETGATGQTGMPGDRYATSAGNQFTLGTGGQETVQVAAYLAYSPGQSIILAHDSNNYQEATVVSYNQNGTLIFEKNSYVGSGTYFNWTVNLGGAVGAAGATGQTGVTGPEGATGVTGVTGPEGATGVTGVTGVTGPEGATGVIGPTPWTLPATLYDNGAYYNIGAAVTYLGGYYYRTGNPLNPGYPPTPGTINESWTPVADGGATGSTGATGVTGVTGPEGVTGATGVTGVTGVTGPEGATGVTGVTGPEGATGVTGVTGQTGPGSVNGTANYIAKFQGATGVGSSIVYETNNNLHIGGTSPNARLQVDATDSSTKGLVVKAAINQTANLQEWQNNSETVLASISNTGQISSTNLKETVFTIADSPSVDIDPLNGGIQIWILGTNRTPTAANFLQGQSVTLMIDDGSAFAITWTSVNVTWVNGNAPTLSTTGYTVIELWKSGSTIYGALVGVV